MLTGSDIASGYGGPHAQFGRSSDPDDYMVIGAYSAINNIDSKDRQLYIQGTSGPSVACVKIQSNYNTATSTKYIIDLYAYHTAGSAGNNQARFIIFRDLKSSTITTIGMIRGNNAGGITIDYSFTGQHATVITSGSYELGMIAESTGEMWVKSSHDIETALPKVQLTSSEKSKTVYGVIANLSGSFEGYIANGGLAADEMHIVVNSIGEGCVLVTNYNGEVQNGDYIVSSPIAGYGMRQDDDLLRSSTVAKCTESVDWVTVNDTITVDENIYKLCLIGCTYHCG